MTADGTNIAALVERLDELLNAARISGIEQNGFMVCIYTIDAEGVGHDHCFRIDKAIGAFLAAYLPEWPRIRASLLAAHLTGELGDSREDARWIPVTERLPDDMDDVVVFSAVNGKIFIAYRMAVVWECDDGIGRMTGEDVTHWMPLPAPPIDAALREGK